MATPLSSKAFSELVSPALNQLYDKAYLNDNSLWFLPKPDDMQPLYELADEVNDGRTET